MGKDNGKPPDVIESSSMVHKSNLPCINLRPVFTNKVAILGLGNTYPAMLQQ
jgi:hypothetical protein